MGPRARDQFAVRMAGHEHRIGEVLRTDVADVVVDHRDLAVVAQVHATAAAPAQAAGHHPVDLDAGRAQPPGEAPVTELGADRVEQDTAAHPAPGRAHRGIGDGRADRVVVHQVVEQVHAFARRIDVGDERGDGPVVVVEQLDRIAAHGHEVAHPLHQRHGFGGRAGGRRLPAQRALRRLALADGL